MDLDLGTTGQLVLLTDFGGWKALSIEGYLKNRPIGECDIAKSNDGRTILLKFKAASDATAFVGESHGIPFKGELCDKLELQSMGILQQYHSLFSPLSGSTKKVTETSTSHALNFDISSIKSRRTSTPPHSPSTTVTAGISHGRACHGDLRLSYKTSGGITVTISKGDITKEQVDVIVSSTDRDLQNKGGAAKAIANAGGPDLKRECRESSKSRELATRGICHTGSGNLPCRHVVHIVAPISQRGTGTRSRKPDKDDTRKELYTLLKKTLKYTSDTVKASSVALPAIGTGTHGIPVQTCAEAFRKAIREFSEEGTRSRSLRQIKLVNIEPSTVKSFIEEFVDDAGRESHRQAYDTRPKVNRQSPGSNSYDESDANDTSDNEKFSLLSLSNDDIAVPSGKGDCDICIDSDVRLQKMQCCQKTMCDNCFERHFKTDPKCPYCAKAVAKVKGNQPRGKMDHWTDNFHDLPGYKGHGTVIVNYDFPDGIQKGDHPNPGQPYTGCRRKVYLPANDEGLEVLDLLKKAFQEKVLFTIGRSVTRGKENMVVWNDIHQKTSKTGGTANYGYPDPTYLSRVKEELAAKGIK